MQIKKIIILSLLMIFSSVFLFSEISILVGPAYTNYFVRSKSEFKFSDVDNNLKEAISKAVTEKNHAAGFAIDMKLRSLYVAMQIAFPGNAYSELIQKLNNTELSPLSRDGAFILDLQAGLGHTFFRYTPFNLFLGLGLGLNAIKSTQIVNINSIPVEYKKIDVLMGLGVNVLANLKIINSFGVYLGFADTFYFAPIKAQKSFNIDSNTYTISTRDNNLKNIIANSVNIKLGVSINL